MNKNIYILPQNVKAYHALRSLGYELVPSKRTDDFDYELHYGENHNAREYPVLIVKGWNGSANAFHRFLMDNKLLLSQQ